MSKVSFYKNVWEKESTNQMQFLDFLAGVKNGDWQDNVLKYRAIQDIEEKKKAKKQIPAVTTSGTFAKTRSIAGLVKHSGFLNIDIDYKDNPDIDLMDFRSLLATDKYIFAFHVSVSGFGLSAYIKVSTTKHSQSFHAIDKYFADEYNVIIDISTKDVSRLRFVSYDPDLHINKASEKWDIFPEKKDLIPKNYIPIYSGSDIDFVLKQITDSSIDLTQSYHDWLKIGFAFVSEFGDGGRNYFHQISRNHPKYSNSATDKKYDNLLKSGGRGVSIASFFWVAKQYGLKIKTEKTKQIEKVARLRRATVGKSGGAESIADAKENAKEYLQEIENIQESESSEIIDKVFNLNEKQLEATEDESEIVKLVSYLQNLDLRKNLITGKLEFNGIDVTDRIENSIYLDAKEIFPKGKFAKQMVLDIMESDRIKDFNPFLEFIEKHKHLKPEGNFLKLMDCIEVPINSYAEHIGKFIKKWLLSIHASIHGTYSLLVLVMVGNQGTGKTKFFREFLPADLLRYYAESTLDKGKDDENLMTEKIVIVDDEFGGKNKKEASKFKDIASKQVFTNRKSYGRNNEDKQRIAVLGGTSNDVEILNDTTGNRRIIPVKISNINLKKFKAIDKTELFIELYHEWKRTGDDWMLTTAEIETLNKLTTDFAEITLEEDLIKKHFKPSDKMNQYAEFMSTTDMINYCEQTLGKQRISIKKFGQVLRKLSYKREGVNGRYGFYVQKG